MNIQQKKNIIIVDDIEGWLMLKILEMKLNLSDFNVMRYRQDSNDLPIMLKERNIFLVCGHSNAEGNFYFGHKVRKLGWSECKTEHLITCFYDRITNQLDEYLRLPGFLEDGSPVLYKLSYYDDDFIMSHNAKYRKKLAIVKLRFETEHSDLINIYWSVMGSFIKKIKPGYESLLLNM